MYVNEVSKGLCDPQAKPTIIKETPSTAYVDGHNGIGSVRMKKLDILHILCQVIGTFCMETAIQKAKQTGVAWVTCTGIKRLLVMCY